MPSMMNLLWLQYLSNLVLKLATLSLKTMSSLKLFQLSIDLTGNILSLSDLLIEGLEILNKCPLVKLSLNVKNLSESISSNPFTILNICIRS